MAPREQALDHLQVLLGLDLAVDGVARVRVHGNSAEGMRARMICVLRISHAVLRLRS